LASLSLVFHGLKTKTLLLPSKITPLSIETVFILPNQKKWTLPTVMIRYYAKLNGKLAELKEPEVGCWINLSPPFNHDELENFAKLHSIDIDFLTDPLDTDERPRYERDEDVRSIIIATPLINNEIDPQNQAIYMTVPIGIVITIEHVITICNFENPVLDLFIRNKVRNFDPINEQRFVLQILEQNVNRFLYSLRKLNHKRNVIEKELYESSRNSEIKQLLSIEKSLVYFVNALNANELLKMKMKRTDFLHVKDDEDLVDLFEDIIIDNSQALDTAKVYTDILGGTMDAYTSIISNNLNMVMKRLTTITIVLMVPTLIASFFGMNLKLPYPIADGDHSFLLISSISLALSLLVVWIFRRANFF
jgi:magnesium transporter